MHSVSSTFPKKPVAFCAFCPKWKTPARADTRTREREPYSVFKVQFSKPPNFSMGLGLAADPRYLVGDGRIFLFIANDEKSSH